MLLAAIVLLPLVGALVVALMPRLRSIQEDDAAPQHLGMVISAATFFTSLGLAKFRPSVEGMQFEVSYPWIRHLGINFHLGVDGISLWLVLLATFLTPVVLLASYSGIRQRSKEFVVALLVLEAGMLGAFMALDLFLFYVFWELILIPMYLIIGIWGHGERTYAALKFVLYTVVGSLPMLVAIIYMYVSHGQATGDYTFDYTVLVQSVWGRTEQLWLFGAFALAFAIKVPIFPLHTWLPDAHTQAPTAGSMVLAGVLLKLGTYGFIRYGLGLFPWAAAALGPYVVMLVLIGIVYGAMVAYVQKDAKRLVAYSSVSHLGFVMLGIFAMNRNGVSGSIYQMLSHGISTGGLFLALGMLYDRRHTHALDEFGGLWKRMPVFGALFLVMLLSSAGLPGLNGFVGEFLILIGSFTQNYALANGQVLAFSWFPRLGTAVAALGVVLGAVYLLHLFQRLMFGPITLEKNRSLKDLSGREFVTFLPLVIMVFVMGIAPRPFLKSMQASVDLFLGEYRTKFLASEDLQSAVSPKRLPVLSYRSRIPVAELSAPRTAGGGHSDKEEAEAAEETTGSRERKRTAKPPKAQSSRSPDGRSRGHRRRPAAQPTDGKETAG